MSRQVEPDTVKVMLTDRARTVIAHLQTDPYGNHTTRSVATATGLAWQQVQSVFALLVQMGWAIYRDAGGHSRPLTLTSNGRSQSYVLADGGEVEARVGAAASRTAPAETGVPLAVLDREDPQAADLVRAKMGWPARHA